MSKIQPYIRDLIVKTTNQNPDYFDKEVKLPPKRPSNTSSTKKQQSTRGGKK